MRASLKTKLALDSGTSTWSINGCAFGSSNTGSLEIICTISSGETRIVIPLFNQHNSYILNYFFINTQIHGTRPIIHNKIFIKKKNLN